MKNETQNEIQREAEHCQIGKNNNKHKNVNTNGKMFLFIS